MRIKGARGSWLARQLGNPEGPVGLLLAPLWNRRNAALNDAAFDALALAPDDRVLEVGFGGGYLLGRMARRISQGFVAGADVSPAMVSYCRRHHRAALAAGRMELLQASAEALPFPDGSFTAACSVNSLFYWRDAEAALAELGRVLAPGGRLVLCFTCPVSLQDRDFSAHIRLWEPAHVAALLETLGFSILSHRQLADRHRDFACITASKPG